MATKEFKKQTILLTGASGTVGRELLKQLTLYSEIYNIRVFDLKNAKSMPLFDKYRGKIKVVYGDITKAEDVKKAAKGVDFCIHMASIIPPAAYKNKEVTTRINVGGTANLIAALESQSPNAFLLFTSSVATYGDRLKDPYIRVGDELKPSYGDNYGETKVQMEQLVQQSKLRWSIFRLSAIMGAQNHKISGLMFYMPLDTPIEITTPSDTARALFRAIKHQDELDHKIFNLGGGEDCRTSYRELLQKNFEFFGLGELDFPDKAFAERNYHCGLYADSDDLENILHFRKDSLADYYEAVRKSVPTLVRIGGIITEKLVKKMLLKKSEPYQAWKNGDTERMKYFF